MLDAGLSGHAIAEAVKRACRRAGVDPAEYSRHSMHAGLVTSAAAAGLAELDIARTSRRKSVPTLRTYEREAQTVLPQRSRRRPLMLVLWLRRFGRACIERQ